MTLLSKVLYRRCRPHSATRPHYTTRAPITELPPEILLEIIAWFDPDDFTPHVSLALTCKHFYNWFMPLIEEEQRQNVHANYYHLWGTCLQHEGDDKAMPRSNAVLDSPAASIKELHFIIDDREKDHQCMLGFICRAKGLEKVHISIRFECDVRWAARAIEVCAAKPGLSTLTISGGTDFDMSPFIYRLDTGRERPAVTQPLAPRRRLEQIPCQALAKGSTHGIFKSFTKPLARVSKGKCQLGCSAHLQPSSVSIETSSIFHPLLLPVTIDVLNNSPIQSLSISESYNGHFGSCRNSQWPQVMSSLRMPHLKKLYIHDDSIPTSDLLAFLYRHDSIEVLNITPHEVSDISELPVPYRLQVMPRLCSMTTGAGLVAHFLKLKKKRGYLRLLQHFYVVKQWDQDFLELYEQLAVGFKNMTLELDSISFVSLVIWIAHQYDRKRQKLERKRKKKQNMQMQTRKMPLRFLHLKGITHLHAHFVPDDLLAESLPHWVKQELDDWSTTHAAYLLQLGVTPFPEPRIVGAVHSYLLICEALLRAVCPNLESLKLDTEDAVFAVKLTLCDHD